MYPQTNREIRADGAGLETTVRDKEQKDKVNSNSKVKIKLIVTICPTV